MSLSARWYQTRDLAICGSTVPNAISGKLPAMERRSIILVPVPVTIRMAAVLWCHMVLVLYLGLCQLMMFT